eukprot:m.32170 g.32170  ORF g.32170 m.32170 type:complete len:339 (+) comp10756_c0_seq1:217-1233(+)
MASYDVFLTHDWGVDSKGRDNHDRVAMINNMLKMVGFDTWFDEERMTGHIVQQMCNGIDNSKAVLVFVTTRYLAKVNSEDDDNCKKEFTYAVRRKTTKNMIPIIMEDAARDTREWQGPVGMELGSHLYVRMTDDKEMRQNLEELVSKLAEMGIHPKRKGSQSMAQQEEEAVKVPREVSFTDNDGDVIHFMVVPDGIGKFVNKKFDKAVTSFDYRPIDGDLRDQNGWGGKIDKADRSRVVNALRLMCADQGVAFRSRQAIQFVDNDGDLVMFCDSKHGLAKYVNGKFDKIVKSLVYRASDHDLRDQDRWGGRMPADKAKENMDQLAKMCRTFRVPLKIV